MDFSVSDDKMRESFETENAVTNELQMKADWVFITSRTKAF